MSRALATGVDAPATVRLLGPGDWPELRAARIQALLDAPEAFVAVASAAERKPSSYWMDTLRRSTWAAAWLNGEIVGVACLAGKEHPASRERFVESVWVASKHRLKGLVWSMLQALEAEAENDGAEWIKLWILETNMPAFHAYERLGFTPVRQSWQDSPKMWPDGTPVKEVQMVKQLFP